MPKELGLGENSKFGNIDFSKLRSGIKKEDLVKGNEFFKSLFDKFDSIQKDGVLSREEIEAMVKELQTLAGEDGELKKAEAKKMQINNDILGKNAKDLFEFINRLAKLTENVKEVKQEGETEVIEMKDGTVEKVFKDGSKEITDPNGNIKKLDKDGEIVEETIVEEEQTKNIKYSQGEKVKETLTEKSGKETVIEYKNGEEVKRTIETKEAIETFFKQRGKEVRFLEDKNTGIIETFVAGKKLESRNKKDGSKTVYKDGVSIKTFSRGNVESEIIKDENEQLLSQKVTTTLGDGSVDVRKTTYDGQNSETIRTIDGKNISQTKVIDGQNYYVEYDGEGNTVVVVQNSETIGMLAKKFGCTVQEIIDANPGKKIGGSGNNRYFYAGEEIKIPREIQADNKYLQNRKSKSEVIARHQAWEAEQAREAEEKRQPEEAAKDAANASAKAQNEANKTKAKELAKEFFGIADDNSGHNSVQKMLTFLQGNVNSSNIVDFLNAYNDPNVRNQDSSIIDTICSEIGADTAIRKKALWQVFNTLVEAARNAKVSESDIQSASNAFEKSMNKQFDSWHRINPLEMENAINYLLGAIAAAKSGVEEVNEKEAMQSVAGDFKATNEQANADFEEARKEDSWLAKAGDAVCGWFGCNTIEDLRAKLGDNAKKVEALIEAANKNDSVAFKRIYKELFGVEFDAKKIEASNQANENYFNAVTAKACVEEMGKLLEQVDESMSFEEIANVIKSLYKDSAEVNPDEVISQIIDSYSQEGFPAETDLDKKQILLSFLENTRDANKKVLDELTATKSIEDLEREAEVLGKAAFGMNDISRLVDQFNENMVMTDMVATAAAEIIGTVALQFVPGLGQAALAKLAVSATRWGVKGAKIANYAKKAYKGFKAVNKFQQGAAFTSKAANVTARISAQAVNAGVATASVGVSKGDDAKTILRRTLMNMSFAGAGVSANMIAPKLMQAFGISSQLATEIAEEIINAASAYGITTIAGDNYGTEDAFLDFITGMIMSRIAGAGARRVGADVDVQGGKKVSSSDVDVTGNKSGSEITKYDNNGNVSEQVFKDADGNVSEIGEYKYDSEGRVVEIISKDADGNVSVKPKGQDSSKVDSDEVDPIHKSVEEQSSTRVKPYSEMTPDELFSAYQALNKQVLDGTLSTQEKSKAVKELKEMSKALEAKGYKIEGNELKALENSEVETDSDVANESASNTNKAERKSRANKLRGLRSKLGRRLARLYVNIEKAIENMKNALDFDKISSKIKSEFASFKTEMNELLNKLNAKMRGFKATAESFVNPSSIGSRYFTKTDIGQFINADFSNPHNLVRQLENMGYKPTEAHVLRYRGNEFVSMVNPKEGILYTAVYKNGKLVNKSKTFITVNRDNSFTRHSDLSVSYRNGECIVEVKDGENVVYENSENMYSQNSGGRRRASDKGLISSTDFKANSYEDLRIKLSKKLNLFSENSQNMILKSLNEKGSIRLQKNGVEYEFVKNGNTVTVNEYNVKNKYDIKQSQPNPYTMETTMQISHVDDIQWAISDKLANFSSTESKNYILNSLRDGKTAQLQKNGISYTFSIDNGGKITVVEEVIAGRGSKASNKASSASGSDPNYDRNIARTEAYAKFNKNQASVELKGEGVLRQDMQYALDMNDLPEMYLYDGSHIDFSTGEIKSRIDNLPEGGYFTIGRDGDVKIGSDTVSRQHILVTKHNGRIVIKDISANGGTFAKTKTAESSQSKGSKAKLNPKENVISVFNKYLKDTKLSENPTEQEIKKAYRELAIEHHPDKFQTEADKQAHEEIFKEFATAYELYNKSKNK